MGSSLFPAVVRYVKDLVMTKKCFAGQLVVRKSVTCPRLRFSTQDIYVSLGRPSAKEGEGEELSVATGHVC